jgi:anti-anti-sigma factor
MDGVEYHATETGNELVLTKRSESAISRGLIPAVRPLRSTLKFKFTLRASAGLLLLIAVIWGFLFVRQTSDIESQRASQWIEKRRVAENLANRSKDLLIRPDEFSLEQTNLSAYIAKLLENSKDLAYVKVVDADGRIASSGKIDEIFTSYAEKPGEVLLNENDRVVWRKVDVNGRDARDIRFAVQITNSETGQTLNLGHVYLGVYEDAIESYIEDTRLMTGLILIGIFVVGVLLILGLVSVFVKPIQMLTDGVRAIGDGNLDGKLDVEGPAEIGAIAGVFNEITDKFKKARDSILEQEKLQKEMEVAKQIQHSLLPREKPNVSGYDIAPLYQAAAEVGGDYYDFVEVDEDTIGVVVADVSGKGVPGSLVMTMIRTALRMEARGNKNASDVMSKMNAFVTDDMKKGMFVTMFYVILDSKNRIISYASAGHNPMILYRHETNETFFLNPKGFPVGISLPDETLFRDSISLEKIKLKKDDMLLIYTDGVTEAMNEMREQYGEERLLAVIKKYGDRPPEDFINHLERDIKKFTAGHPQNDDITVVAVKEKLAADDVLFGIRKKLLDLVDVQGLSVKEACRQMRVSPATYYRYKKRVGVMGERGLKDKILRQDIDLKRVSLEARKVMLDIIQRHPGYGAKRITAEFNKNRDEDHRITERMVYDELKRLNLNTKELRLDYLRRNRLIDEEMEVVERKTGKEIVDDFLKEIDGIEAPPEAIPEADDGLTGEGVPAVADQRAGGLTGFERIDGVGLTVTDSGDGVTTVCVNGHLDSVTSATLEKKLKQLISEGSYKFIVDLSEVTYISSGGWGIFTGEVRNLRQNGGDVILVGMTADVYDVYELLGFSELLKAFATPEEGQEYFRLSPEERFAMPSKPVAATDDTGETVADREMEVEEEVAAEGYVPEWESLLIEATTVGPEGEIAVISLRGIIDTVSAESLRRALDKVISGGISRVVVDMSQVEYVSSGGWGTFTERLREVRRNGGDIKLFGMDPDVYYVFTMLGFNIVLSSFDILGDAIEDFKREAGAERLPRQAYQPEADGDRAAHSEPSMPESQRPAAELPPGVDLSRRDVADVVEWEDIGEGYLVAHMKGPVEASAVDVLARSLMQTMTTKPRCVFFDLSGVSYISSTGWGLFAKCYATSREWGGTVALYGMDSSLHDIYDCLEFRAFIAAYGSLADALEAVKSPDTPQVARDAGGATDGESTESYEESDFTDEAVISIDDILGDDVGDGGPDKNTGEGEVPTIEAAPDERDGDTRRWPGDVLPDESKPAVPADTSSTVPDASPPENGGDSGGETTFVDITGGAGTVDVNSAVTDKNRDRDERLRVLGWEKYGEKLRNRGKRRKKGDDG